MKKRIKKGKLTTKRDEVAEIVNDEKTKQQKRLNNRETKQEKRKKKEDKQ